MGIDNDAVSYFGIKFTFNEVKHIIDIIESKNNGKELFTSD
jgi:hypothetical protein